MSVRGGNHASRLRLTGPTRAGQRGQPALADQLVDAMRDCQAQRDVKRSCVTDRSTDTDRDPLNSSDIDVLQPYLIKALRVDGIRIRGTLSRSDTHPLKWARTPAASGRVQAVATAYDEEP
jgi:hypothetical protein